MTFLKRGSAVGVFARIIQNADCRLELKVENQCQSIGNVGSVPVSRLCRFDSFVQRCV